MLSRSDCDVIAVVRGGGARADLAAFETEVVARAVAGAAKPVFTGIGHTGDETVADIVAARGVHHADRVRAADRGGDPALVGGARGGAGRAPGAARPGLPRATPRPATAQARGRLTAAARQQLRVHRERLGTKGSSLGRAAPDRLESCTARLRAHATRLGPLGRDHLGRQRERVQSWRRLLAAYDVDRQLERGYSLTLTLDGRLVRGAGGSGRAAGDRDPLRRRHRAQPGGGDHARRCRSGRRWRRGARGRRPEVTVPEEPVPVEQLSYTEASRELDAIVNFFEQRDVDVDVLVGRLERATALIDELDRRLRRTQAQVEELVPRLDALAGDVAGTDAGGDDDD